jgi:hypothetical protein
MAIVTKATLKTYFEQGDIPTQGQYVDLIDSNLNLGESETTQIIQGTISASAAIVGYVELKKMYIPGIGVGSATVGTTFTVGRSLEVIGDINTTDNISASGTGSFGFLALANISTSGYLIAQNITASSNISASGYLQGVNFHAFNTITRVGAAAGGGNTGLYQTAIGDKAGNDNSGDSQTAIGYRAGGGNQGDSQIAIGVDAGSGNSGDSQTAIGYEAGYYNSGNNLVAIGYGAGLSNTLDNQFIVLHSDANATPLIQGNFRTSQVGIGLALPQANLHVSGNIWASGSNGNITASANISASGRIIATSFTGSLQGTATSATTVTVATTATNATHYLTFTDTATGNEDVKTDTSLTYNPSSNTLTTGPLVATTVSATTVNAAKYQYGDSQTLTAGGGSQGDATPISDSGYTGPIFVTGVSGRGILLPRWSQDVYILTIHNISPTDKFLLYPSSGESIGTLVTDAPATVPEGGSIILTSGGPNEGQWQGYLGNVII